MKAKREIEARSLLFIAYLLFNFISPVSGQVLGDFQSRQTGNWNQSSTWQQWNGLTWVNVLASDGFPRVAATSVSRVDPSATTHTVALPGGITAGDLLILLWTDNATNSSSLGGADLTSWTALYNENTLNNRRAAFYKIATGAEANSMTLTTTLSESSAHNVYRIAAGTWQGIPEVSALATATTSTPAPPSLNPSGWGTEHALWIITDHIAGDGNMSIAAPANYTSSLIRIGTGGGGGGGDAIMASSYRMANTATESPGSFTNGQSRSTSAATIAIRGNIAHTYPRVTFPVVASTASSAETADVTSHRINLPSGITAGDLLLVFYADRDVVSTVTITGWTEIYNNLDASGKNRRSAYYRIADGTEAAIATFTTTAQERSAHTSYRILKGTYQGTPIAGSVNTSTADNKNPDPPTHDPGWGGKNILWIAASHSTGDDNNTAPSAPANYYNMLSGYTGNKGPGHARVLTAQRELAMASDNPGTFSLPLAVNWAANTVAIQGSGSATVLNGHTVTVTENVSVPQVRVNSGGTVAINNSITFTTPASGSFTVSGTLQTGTDGTASLVGSGAFSLNSGGTLWVSSPLGIAASANSGNIRVTGGRTFSTSGNYHFNGTNDQSTGDALNVVNDLTVSGASMKTLSNNITVNGTLTFNDARIQSTLDKLLTMAKANSINGYGQNGMVIGSLKIIGTGSTAPYEVVFPLRGKSQLQTVKIKYGTLSNTDAMTVSYVGSAHNGSKNQQVDEVSSLEYWDITPGWSTGSLNAQNGVSVELSYRSSNSNKYFPTRITESYGLGHYNGTQWEIAGPMNTLAHNTADNGVIGTVSMGGIKNFSPFTPIAINPTMLPVDLGEFTATLNSVGKVDLRWSTFSESLNKGFAVERMVVGKSVSFEQIGYVLSKSANGNSVNILHYGFADQHPVAGAVSLYRIVQEDLDGKKTPSEVKTLRIQQRNEPGLFPNPSTGRLYLVPGVASARYDIQVIDQQGNVVRTHKQTSAEPLALQIDQPGIYRIQLTRPETGELWIKTIMIQR